MHVPVHVRRMGRPGLSTFMQGPTIQRIHIQGPTIQTYEGHQGPGTMLLKSGTVPEIRGPLRPMCLRASVSQEGLRSRDWGCVGGARARVREGVDGG